MNPNLIPTAEAAKALGLTPSYFRFIANSKGWQYETLGRNKLWLKADVASYLAESLEIRNATYTLRILQQITGLSRQQIHSIARKNKFIQPQQGRWFKADWNPILEKKYQTIKE